jgi:hypothetical protein
MVIALLCGCVASGASELPTPTEPANQPAARLPLNAEPTPQLPNEHAHTLGPSNRSDITYSGCFNNITEVVYIRNLSQLKSYLGKTASEQYADYDYDYFMDHSLIVFKVEGCSSRPLRQETEKLTQDESGNYHLYLKIYWPTLTNWQPLSGTIDIVFEIDQVIPADSHVEFHFSYGYE